MPIQPAAIELLTALAPIASGWGRWYVFGAQAVIVYGVPRLSADVDVTLALDPGAAERFVVDMQAGGFTSRGQDPEFIQRTRVIPFVHRTSGMPLDVVLGGSGLEDDFLSRPVPTDIGGVTVPLIAPSDLIIAKILAGRTKEPRRRSSVRTIRKRMPIHRLRLLVISGSFHVVNDKNVDRSPR